MPPEEARQAAFLAPAGMLALAIGTTTAMFTIADALISRTHNALAMPCDASDLSTLVALMVRIIRRVAFS
jgi:hypothetical protein